MTEQETMELIWIILRGLALVAIACYVAAWAIGVLDALKRIANALEDDGTKPDEEPENKPKEQSK
jgi:hypothetical protein